MDPKVPNQPSTRRHFKDPTERQQIEPIRNAPSFLDFLSEIRYIFLRARRGTPHPKERKISMKVKYIGDHGTPLSVFKGKTYECLGKERDRYRIIDETGEDYLYPAEEFGIVEEETER